MVQNDTIHNVPRKYSVISYNSYFSIRLITNTKILIHTNQI